MPSQQTRDAHTPQSQATPPTALPKAPRTPSTRLPQGPGTSFTQLPQGPATPPTLDSDRRRRRPLTLLRWLAAALFVAALIVLATAFLTSSSLAVAAANPAESTLAVALSSVALALAAVLCWRSARIIDLAFQESQAWTEVAQLESILAERENQWSALPAAAAAWDSAGQLLLATAAWRTLGAPIDAPPDRPELSLGDPPRVFVVETTAQPLAGIRAVFLREVTRERQALQAKDDLLAIVGHELRTPLTAIKGYGQLMARQLATVQEQVQRLDGLIDDVMDTAQAEGGRLNLRREPLSVSDLVQNACDRFAAAHPSRRVEKELSARSFIDGDASRLNQVMDNLLGNAAKYSPPDTAIEVRTFADKDRERVSVAISDHGVGIAKQHLPHLFDRFYRVPSDEPGGPAGFGLGLSIVRDLVEAHGGQVTAASEGPGTGCTFTVNLPVTLPLDSDVSPPPTQSPAPQPASVTE